MWLKYLLILKLYLLQITNAVVDIPPDSVDNLLQCTPEEIVHCTVKKKLHICTVNYDKRSEKNFTVDSVADGESIRQISCLCRSGFSTVNPDIFPEK